MASSRTAEVEGWPRGHRRGGPELEGPSSTRNPTGKVRTARYRRQLDPGRLHRPCLVLPRRQPPRRPSPPFPQRRPRPLQSPLCRPDPGSRSCPRRHPCPPESQSLLFRPGPSVPRCQQRYRPAPPRCGHLCLREPWCRSGRQRAPRASPPLLCSSSWLRSPRALHRGQQAIGQGSGDRVKASKSFLRLCGKKDRDSAQREFYGLLGFAVGVEYSVAPLPFE